METLRPRRRMAPVRFLGVVSAGSPPDSVELQEHEILWTSSSPERNHDPNKNSVQNKTQPGGFSRSPPGILAVLQQNGRGEKIVAPVLQRKQQPVSPTSSSIPRSVRSESGLASRSVPAGKMMYRSTAPVRVPATRRASRPEALEVEDGGEDGVMLPPHEIVAARSLRSTFSVLEGVGRTLKGRDLRRVRNGVWRQTGFLDL